MSMRVLHLFDAAGPHACSTTLSLLAQSLDRLGDIEQTVCLLGSDGFERKAALAGVKATLRINTPFGRAFTAWPTLLRRIKGTYDLIHCWSPAALTLAAMRFRHVPRVMTAAVAPSGRTAHWLRMVCAEAAGRTALLPISSTIRRTLLSSAIPEHSVHVLRPAIDMSAASASGRKMLRKSWGVDDRHRVIMFVSDPPHDIDVVSYVVAMSLANDAISQEDPPLRLLLHPEQRGFTEARRMLKGMHREHWVLSDEVVDRPWAALPACDVALAVEEGAGGMSLLWAMAANVPIVGEATYAVSEVVEDRHSALLVKPGMSHALANRIVQVVTDKQVAWQIRDTARHEAYSFFSRQRYCQSLRTVYEQLVSGAAIEVPAMEVTGGLRFSGRA